MNANRNRSVRRLQRGVSLLEGLIASMVLLVGLVGVLQGLYTSAQQNAVANRMTRASAITRQIIGGLHAQGRARLEASGGLLASGSGGACVAPSSFTSPEDLLDGLGGTITGFDSICAADVEAYDLAGTTTSDLKIVPLASYTQEDQDRYGRYAVYIRNSADPDNTAYVAVIVTWRDLGRRFYHREIVSFYDTAVNQTGVEL